VLTIEADPASAGWWIVTLKAGSTEPVRLETSWSQARAGNSDTVVPAAVAGAVRHRGVIVVSQSSDLQLRFAPRNDASVPVSPREVIDEHRRHNETSGDSFPS